MGPNVADYAQPFYEAAFPIGIIAGSVFFTFPHAMIIIQTALSISDARLYEASDVLGARRQFGHARKLQGGSCACDRKQSRDAACCVSTYGAFARSVEGKHYPIGLLLFVSFLT